MEQRYEVGKMRMGHVQVGQVWMMEAPKRLVKVVEQTMVELPDDQKRMRQEPCFACKATVPTLPIKGHVGKKEAKGNILLCEGIRQEAAADPEDTPADYEWTEVWAERFLFGLVKHPRWPVPVVNDAEKAPRYPILCCVQAIGRDTTRKASSPIEGTRLGGALVNPKDVPAGLFGESDAKETARPEADGEGTSPVEARQAEGGTGGGDGGGQEVPALPKTYPGLLKLAKARGVDTSDLPKKGAVAVLRERLSA